MEGGREGGKCRHDAIKITITQNVSIVQVYVEHVGWVVQQSTRLRARAPPAHAAPAPLAAAPRARSAAGGGTGGSSHCFPSSSACMPYPLAFVSSVISGSALPRRPSPG